MHREEAEQWLTCAGCGEPFDDATEQGYRFGAEVALCFICATERGGRYDPAQDRWTRAPEMSDLPERRELEG